jgi:hypothetical protein
MPRFKLVDGIDWPRLNGQRITVEISANYIVGILRDGTLVTLAKALRERPAASTRATPKRLKAAEEG